MDPQTDLPDLVEDLEVNIDELSAILSPLLNAQLSTTASSLPLLDKAKLYVLAAYSIESLLYSSLQASGVNAKEHAIFRELARLKGYFAKIKSVEERPIAAPKAKLDVGAAARSAWPRSARAHNSRRGSKSTRNLTTTARRSRRQW
jgi:exosome complex protein LRP1